MSVTGFMYNINATKKIGELELEAGLEGHRSWHNQHQDSAYIYIGGLHPGLTEGDIVVVFSQFGEIIDVNLIRDKSTGDSKGFCFVCYEDQRSTVLAVDNLNGYKLLQRTLRVDHVSKYKAPKILDENDLDADGNPILKEYKATGSEGKGCGIYNVVESQQKIFDVSHNKKVKEVEKHGLEDEDEAWAKAFEAGLDSNDKKVKKAKKKKAKKKERLKIMEEHRKTIKELTIELKNIKDETKRIKMQIRTAKEGNKIAGKTRRKVETESSGKSSKSSGDSDSN